ncbi:hypothetical protein CYMTET_3788 [Cymbomonas tetramitiformis]|uniref:Uncharacterized protein n=1 Tax=Cymbomonas tetramitiformis TaxID=36881 RepID=A0AAE0LKH5_9CHLO|nr:hypothetical protein CYMTET_3788 [Cymbomonas tetramitiformis]
MSDQNMLTTFRAGLRYAGKVMRRLHQERLDISKPEEWEQRAREQNFPGTHVALLKLREIADNVETDMESKAADKLAAERASRSTPFSPSTNSGRTPFFRNRAASRPRAPLAVMGDSSVATAAAATSTTPTTASSVAAPGAWHWRRTRNTLPLEEAVNRVRRALRESPEAARTLVDKMTARTRNFAHTRGIRLRTRTAALRTLIQQLQAAMDVEQGLYSAAGRQHHTPLASVPSENLGFDADLCSAWSELSPTEQQQAMRSSPPSSRPGTRPWEQLGLARLRARRHGMWLQSEARGQIATLGVDAGTIPDGFPSADTSTTSHVSATPDSTPSSHVSATVDGAGHSVLSALASEELGSHPLSVDEKMLRCERIRMDGGVQWGKPEHGILAAARDEEGPLLLVFYAHLKGHQVKVLVDSDGSVKTTGHTAYAKFTADVASGGYTENALALRVLPLGIQVDVVLGGRWLRSLSPVTLGYEGNGSISFNRRTRSGKPGERVTISGCCPGTSHAPKRSGKGACAGLIDEVFLTAAQLKKHLIYAETRKLKGDDDPDLQPAWIMMARRDPDSEESAFAAVATDSTADSPSPLPSDNQDADVSLEWTLKFQEFMGKKYETEVCDALPNLEHLRHDAQDEAYIPLDAELSKKGPPSQRAYKKSSEELRHDTLEDHHRHVEQLLLTCREKGVFLKRSKVQLLKKSLRFLGHTISADGCRPQHDKVAAVLVLTPYCSNEGLVVHNIITVHPLDAVSGMIRLVPLLALILRLSRVQLLPVPPRVVGECRRLDPAREVVGHRVLVSVPVQRRMDQGRSEAGVCRVAPGVLQEASLATSSASGMGVGAEVISSWAQMLPLG